MRVTPLLRAAAVLCVVLGASACGGDSDEKTEAELVDDISEVIRENQPGLDEDQAECWAEIIVDEAGADALNDVDLAESEPPAALQDQITAAAQRAVEDCGITGSGG